MIENSLRRRVFAEWFGTAALLAVVVGSGQMGEALSPGNTAVALLANSIATALGLWVLIELLAPVSGAHFNPIVSATFALRRELPVWDACAYMAAQFVGAICGVWLAHLMFDLSIYQTGVRVRDGLGQFTSETTASAGLIVTILVGRVSRPSLVPGRSPSHGRAVAVAATIVGCGVVASAVRVSAHGVGAGPDPHDLRPTGQPAPH